MSTYVYLECLDHDPPLQAEDESGQHLYDLPRIRTEVRNRATIVARYEATYGSEGGYFERNTARFLADHPKCRLGIRDEYGREHRTGEPR